MSKNVIIGIGGPSRSGKSTLANRIKKLAISKHLTCEIISLDDYIKPTHELPLINGVINWESPNTIDWRKVEMKMQTALKAESVLVVEGLFAFSEISISKHYTHTIWLELTKENFLLRKIEDKRWGEIPQWYVNHIWESSSHLTKPSHHILFAGNVETLDSKSLLSIF